MASNAATTKSWIHLFSDTKEMLCLVFAVKEQSLQQTMGLYIFCRVDAKSPEEHHMILKSGVEVCDGMPSVLAPPGLRASRQYNLYDTIRQFCRSEEAKDGKFSIPAVQKDESHKAKRLKLN